MKEARKSWTEGRRGRTHGQVHGRTLSQSENQPGVAEHSVLYLCRTNRKEATEGKLFQTFDLAVTLNLLKKREEKRRIKTG